MLDARLRQLIDGPLDRAGRWIARRGIGADQVTLAGFGIGMLAAASIAFAAFKVGLLLIVLNRVSDGLDGAVARATRKTDRGAFLEISLDFAFYAAIPLAFAVADPPANALAAAFLLAAFLANGSAFLAFAVLAAKRQIESTAQGEKSLYYLAGLAEGGETIAVFLAFCLWPAGFPWLAGPFAMLCLVSAAARIMLACKRLFDPVVPAGRPVNNDHSS